MRHAISVLLQNEVGALTRMTGNAWPSAFVAGVFAVHPLHVESVAWISERKDVLAGLFFALGLYAYAWYAEKAHSRVRYAAVFSCFVLGVLSKSSLLPSMTILGPEEGFPLLPKFSLGVFSNNYDSKFAIEPLMKFIADSIGNTPNFYPSLDSRGMQ